MDFTYFDLDNLHSLENEVTLTGNMDLENLRSFTNRDRMYSGKKIEAPLYTAEVLVSHGAATEPEVSAFNEVLYDEIRACASALKLETLCREFYYTLVLYGQLTEEDSSSVTSLREVAVSCFVDRLPLLAELAFSGRAKKQLLSVEEKRIVESTQRNQKEFDEWSNRRNYVL